MRLQCQQHAHAFLGTQQRLQLGGLAAARAAGLACIVTPTAYTAADEFTGALRVLSAADGLGRCPDAAAARPATLDDLRRWHAAIGLTPSG